MSGALGCSSHVAAKCVSEILNMGGCSSKSICIAYLLRSANASPLGGYIILGGVPGIASKTSLVSRSGIDESNAQVYGCAGE